MARQRSSVVIRPSQRRQQSKWQREKSRQRAVITAGVIALFFILLIPAYGYWANFIAPPRAVVLQVDDTNYTLGYMAKYLTGVLELTGSNLDMSYEPFRLLQLLEENELVRSGAEQRGINADPDDVDQEVRDRIIGASTENLVDLEPGQLDKEFEEGYRQYLDTINLSVKEHRYMVEADLLRLKLTDALADEIPSSAEQSMISWIVLPEDRVEDIPKIIEGLEAGQEFVDLAEEFSSDRTTAVNGGEVGWVPQNAYPSLDSTISSLEPGEVSGAVQVGTDTYFLKLNDTDEDRVIEPAMIDRLKSVALQIWLLNDRGNHRISVCFGGGSSGGACDWQYDWLSKRLHEASLR